MLAGAATPSLAVEVAEPEFTITAPAGARRVCAAPHGTRTQTYR
jgi:hypothetical protein